MFVRAPHRRARGGRGVVAAVVVAIAALLASAGPWSGAGAASAAAISPQVVGGSDTRIINAPWQVALLHTGRPSDNAAQFCGGSLIALDWIVTAAHCVDGETTSSVKVLHGTATLSTTSYNGRPIDRIVMHPQYDSFTTNNDIALLHLVTPIVSTFAQSPISLATTKPAVGTPGRITGWGSTTQVAPGDSRANYPTTLQMATAPVIADSTCSAIPGLGFISTTMLCAGAKVAGQPNYSTDTCQGDSGGPLAILVNGVWRLAGVTSFGIGCDWSTPGIYTNVANYGAWITANAVVDFMASPNPVIVGTTVAKVGVVQSAAVGTWSPAPTSFTYQWKITASGVSTVVATTPTYTPKSADVGKALTVSVTASRAWYRTTIRTSAAVVVR